MSTRSAWFLASAAFLAAASPAQAQDNRYANLPDDDYADAAYDAAYEAAEAAEAAEHAARMHGVGAAHHQVAANHSSSTHRLAYSIEEREAWLADCRIVMRGEDYYYDQEEYDDRDNRRGGLIGGLLGAVIGGVAGNRIGGAGDRLAGTLLGAGAGGIAGAVLGSVIAGDDDDYDYDNADRRSAAAADAYAADYCEAYLRRYEASGSTGQYAVAYGQPVMIMHAASAQHNGGIREIIREEWVEVAAEPAPARRHAAPRRAAPQRGKLTPVK